MVALSALLLGMKARGAIGVHQSWALITLHSQLHLLIHMPVSHKKVDFYHASSTEMLYTFYMFGYVFMLASMDPSLRSRF